MTTLGRGTCVYAPNWKRRCAGLLGALSLAAALVCSRDGRAGLQTNFEESYALYEQCLMSTADYNADGDVNGMDLMTWQRGFALGGQTDNTQGDADGSTIVDNPDLTIWKGKFGFTGGLPASVCFKLYFDPTGITEGRVTAFVDAPVFSPGQIRFGLGKQNGVFAADTRYSVQLVQSNILMPPGRQRLEAKVHFNAVDPTNPPAGPVTIFGFQVQDQLPALSLEGVQAGFEFQSGDFITLFDSNNGQTTVFNETQLQDVQTRIDRPILQPSDPILAIDVDPLSSNSNYPAGKGPISSFDGNVTTKYQNLAKRNAGFISGNSAAQSVVQSMLIRTAVDAPEDDDPASYIVYGTNDLVVSPDNSAGANEIWNFIASGPLNLPPGRGVVAPPVQFANSTPYRSYRVVFPDLKDFRAADSMQIADIALSQSPSGMPPNILQSMSDPRDPIADAAGR